MSKPAKMATVKDVALLAQVSLATVSRAFNSPAQLDASTLEKVRAAAQKLKYQPLGVARSLRARRSMVVGAIFQSMENASYIAGMVELSQSLFAQHGYTMVLASSHFSDEHAVEAARAMVRQGVDALMLINSRSDTGVFPLLSDFAVPCVATWVPIPGQPSRGFDHLRAIHDVTGYLLNLGHRDFAVVIPFRKTNDHRRERFRVIEQMLAAHAIGPDRCHLLDDGGLGIWDGRHAFARILEQAPRTTAIICGNDNLAAGVVLEALSRGMRVPRDMSVTGYNDLEIASALNPSITTVRTPYEPVARAAVDYLLARMAGKAPPFSELIPTELVVRESTGAPRTTV